LTDLVGRQIVLTGGSVLLAISLVFLAQARAYSFALAAVILFSAAWALLINVGNVLTPLAFPGSLAYATNLANVFFGLGAFLSPLAIAFLVRRYSFPLALAVLGGLSLVPAGLALGVDFSLLTPVYPSSTDLNTTGSKDVYALFGDPILWLCGFALFFYGPLEASVSAWTTTYLGEKGLGEETASGLLSAFWLTFMGARLLTAFTLPPGWEAMFILVLSLACVVVLTGVVLGRSPKLAVGMVLGAGLVFGPIFPTIMAILLGHFDARLHGRAVGMLFAIGGIGWTAIPILIGAYARRTSVQRGFLIAVAAAIGLSGIALALAAR
jgi:fucose permease